jgi:hypothetical protein
MGRSMMRNDNNMRNAAVNPFFHLCFTVRIVKYFLNNTYKVYAPNIAGMKNCNSLNRRIPNNTIAASSKIWRMIPGEMRVFIEHTPQPPEGGVLEDQNINGRASFSQCKNGIANIEVYSNYYSASVIYLRVEH